MGQLEKYGLYVLCLVIFLILGVAIWGGDPAANLPPTAKEVAKLAATEGGKGKELSREQQPKDQSKEPQKPAADPGKAPGKDGPAKDAQGKELEGFFTPVGNKSDAKGAAAKDGKAGPAAPVKADGKPEDSKPAAPRTYVVQDHDTLSKIAEKELGSRGRLAEIEALNPTVRAGRIHKGDQIRLPAARTAPAADVAKNDGKADAKHEAKSEPKVEPKAAAAGKPVPGKPYKVQNGDTLTSIAVAAYGSEKRVKDIFAANHGKLSSMHKLPNNITLMLP